MTTVILRPPQDAGASPVGRYPSRIHSCPALPQVAAFPQRISQSEYSVEDFGFDKTRVPVKMAQFAGQRLVSRSQAKRVLARMGEFKTATFDFAGVEVIGQAFADEIFRVFHNAHIRLDVVNAGPYVS